MSTSKLPRVPQGAQAGHRRPLGSILLLATCSVLAVGCSNLERSRDLANPAVPAQTIALQVCSNCHGIDGNSVSPAYPRLAGQNADYIKKQLTDFRGHGRTDPAGSEYMWGISQHLSDAQIAGLADYYAAHKAHRSSTPEGDPRLVDQGREIFEKGVPDQAVMACALCHGPDAAGKGTIPRLRDQHADYIVKQLEIFQNTHGRPDTPMDAVVHPLTPAIKQAVAAYLTSLPE